MVAHESIDERIRTANYQLQPHEHAFKDFFYWKSLGCEKNARPMVLIIYCVKKYCEKLWIFSESDMRRRLNERNKRAVI